MNVYLIGCNSFYKMTLLRMMQAMQVVISRYEIYICQILFEHALNGK